jgi:hypothetical protein
VKRKIGIVPGSFKPYHVGHDSVIRLASIECDEVHVYASTSDRARPGETTIRGVDAETIWRRYVLPVLPHNVTVSFGGSPINRSWKELRYADETRSDDTFYVYGDTIDVEQRFNDAALAKYVPNAFFEGRVHRRGVGRTSDESVDISGTKMRTYVASGDMDAFYAGLPKDVDKEAIWNLLRTSLKR